jgi:hypothetical protein
MPGQVCMIWLLGNKDCPYVPEYLSSFIRRLVTSRSHRSTIDLAKYDLLSQEPATFPLSGGNGNLPEILARSRYSHLLLPPVFPSNASSNTPILLLLPSSRTIRSVARQKQEAIPSSLKFLPSDDRICFKACRKSGIPIREISWQIDHSDYWLTCAMPIQGSVLRLGSSNAY